MVMTDYMYHLMFEAPKPEEYKVIKNDLAQHKKTKKGKKS